MTSSTLGDPTPPTPGLRAGTWTHITVQVREASAFLELNFSSLGTRTLNKSLTLVHGRTRTRAAAPLGGQDRGRCPLCTTHTLPKNLL